MRVLFSSLFIAGLLTVAVSATAGRSTSVTHYRWHDGHGGLHYSDAIPPDAVRFGYDILNDQGMLVRHIDREKTPAERAAAQADADRAAATKRAAQQQAMADQQLLSAYPTEAELREAHSARLAQMQQSIGTLQNNLQSQEQSLADLLAHAADLQRSGQPVSKFMQERVATQRQSVADERNEITRLQQERVRTAQQQSAELLRYRGLRAKMQSEMGSGN